jgi:crotonobetainyl-CoA:carnitine CoA-transferase CaiB-like acyl-CoA transferase
MSETPPSIERGAPALGEHNQEILRDILGYDDQKIKSLIAANAVGTLKE